MSQAAPVLVAYDSKHGATAEIAQRIAEVLQASGLQVDLLVARDVRELSGYNAIVLGSALYNRRWRRDARGLARHLRRSVPGREVWLFSSGPLDAEAHDARELAGRAVRELADCPDVRGHKIFAGRYPVEPCNFIERFMVKHAPGARRDFRDWPAIEAWAHTIARQLSGELPRAA